MPACAAVRSTPANIKEFDGRVAEVAKAAGAAGIPIRIGVNAGSLDKRFMEKYGKATPEALVESALWEGLAVRGPRLRQHQASASNTTNRW